MLRASKKVFHAGCEHIKFSDVINQLQRLAIPSNGNLT